MRSARASSAPRGRPKLPSDARAPLDGQRDGFASRSVDRWSAAAHAARWLIASALVVPAAVVAIDVAARWRDWRIFRLYHPLSFWLGIAISLAVWALLFEAARHPARAVRGAAIAFIAFFAAFGIGGQLYFRLLTNGYVNREALLLATQIGGVVGGWVAANAVGFFAALLVPAAAVAIAAGLRARRFGTRAIRPSLVAAAALALVAFAVFLPADGVVECLPPDAMFLHALGGPLLYWAHLAEPPQTLPPGKHRALPPLAPVDASAPSIVLLFGESVRRDRVCLAPSPSCDLSPALDAAAPNRVGFAHAFALASCTELSSAWLFSGLDVTASSEDVAAAPLLWDYAKARGYRTAYLASQDLGYGNLGLYVRSSRIDLTRESRDRGREWGAALGSPDEITTQEALAFLQEPGPAFVVVHFANTHDPYREVPAFKRFPTKATTFKPIERKNAYLNSLFAHDAVVGDFLKALRAGPKTERTIVLYVSDHGEAWEEHGAIGHTSDMFAEQLDVPLWIDAPAGSIDAGVIKTLRDEAPQRSVPLPDVAATVVDLLGVLDAPELRASTARLGASLLRPLRASRPPALLWNCPTYRGCAWAAFGALDWPLKFHWVGRDKRYVCSDLAADPDEKVDLPASRCGALPDLVRAHFGAPAASAP